MVEFSLAAIYEEITGNIGKLNGKNKYICGCPFHKDRTPSAVILGDSVFYCSSCSTSLNTFGFVQNMLGLSNADTAKWLSDRSRTGTYRRQPYRKDYGAEAKEKLLEKQRDKKNDVLIELQKSLKRREDIRTEADAQDAAATLSAIACIEAELDEIETRLFYMQHPEKLASGGVAT